MTIYEGIDQNKSTVTEGIDQNKSTITDVSPIINGLYYWRYWPEQMDDYYRRY